MTESIRNVDRHMCQGKEREWIGMGKGSDRCASGIHDIEEAGDKCSRIPDRAERRDASAGHPVDDLLRQLLVGDDAYRFGVEFFDKAVRELHHVWLAVLACV